MTSWFGTPRSGAVTPFRIGAAMLLLTAGLQAQTGNISATDKYAWSENAGWLDFRPNGGGVTVYSDHLEGYAWSENVGWIKLGSHTGGGAHTYANTTNANWGVNRSGENLTGYAWSENAGWINFGPTGGGVSLNNSTGDFDGYAWSENLGWIHFKNASPAYKVNCTNPTRVSLSYFRATAGPDGVKLEWQTGSELNTAGFHLWRSVNGSRRERIMPALLASRGDSGQGAIYSYMDESAPTRALCRYWLEEMDTSGASSYYGPVRVKIGFQP